MSYVIAALFVFGLLAPFFGADSRDGLDWSAGHFWCSENRGRFANAQPTSIRPAGKHVKKKHVKKTGSHAPAGAARAEAPGCRTSPTAC